MVSAANLGFAFLDVSKINYLDKKRDSFMQVMECSIKRSVFAFVAEMVRTLPNFRGKVGVTQRLYRALQLKDRPFHVRTILTDEQLTFSLGLARR